MENLNELNERWDNRMAELDRSKSERACRLSDNSLMLDYRNAIVIYASTAPRLDDINARFLVEELQEKITAAINEFDEKRRALL